MPKQVRRFLEPMYVFAAFRPFGKHLFKQDPNGWAPRDIKAACKTRALVMNYCNKVRVAFFLEWFPKTEVLTVSTRRNADTRRR